MERMNSAKERINEGRKEIKTEGRKETDRQREKRKN
jgi:hypothetical protein